MELTVNFTSPVPSWTTIQTRWGQAGIPISIRMIDGLPAFPDELPGENWQEVRLSTSAGMLTLRRGEGVISTIVWGNADPELVRHWQISAWVCAAAGDGHITTPDGVLSAEAFLRSARLFEA
jgi:hypothetical protein